MGVTVGGLADGDVEAPLEVVVLVAAARRGQPFEQALEVAEQERLIFVDGESRSVMSTNCVVVAVSKLSLEAITVGPLTP
ncbi:MAG: hypothetical protein E6J53_05150 [Chloroflexi bacterium]|nr:MAG: hypothetical protein E6J53_05150 [Chloroflexota bacterium]